MNREELKLNEGYGISWLHISPWQSAISFGNIINNIPVDDLPYTEVFYEMPWLDNMYYTDHQVMIDEFCIKKAEEKLKLDHIPCGYQVKLMIHGKEICDFSRMLTHEEFTKIMKSNINLNEVQPIRKEYECEIEDGETVIKADSYEGLIENIIKFCMNNWQLFSYRSTIEDAIPESFSEKIYRGDKLLCESYCNTIHPEDSIWIKFALKHQTEKKELFVSERIEYDANMAPIQPNIGESYIEFLDKLAHTSVNACLKVSEDGILNHYGDYCCSKYNHYISGKEPHAERDINLTEDDFNCISRLAYHITLMDKKKLD